MEIDSRNFTEAGHSKVSADWIGGVIKRTTDQEITHGSDNCNAHTFINTMQKKNSKSHLLSITDTDIKNNETLLPKILKSIPNIMKLYQLVWSRETKYIRIKRNDLCFM